LCAGGYHLKNIDHEQSPSLPAEQSRLKKYLQTLKLVFKAGTHDKLVHATQYMKGLFQGQKRNIERMVERVADSDYYQVQHFISESPWDARAGFDKVASDTSVLFSSYNRVGLLIDESAHRKKGKESVGVARQYCGTIGKVDNCQVAVYGALSAEKYYGLIDTALYLPEEWVSDEARCKKAGIPALPKGEKRVCKTKVGLALDIIRHQKELGTWFHYVGADGLYGNSYHFQQELDKMGILFVLDIHSDQYVYTEPPAIAIPGRTAITGPAPSRYKATGSAIEVSALAKNIAKEDWQPIRLRQTGKGDLGCLGHSQKVYLWDGESSGYMERKLVIRVTENKGGSREYKYAISNAMDGECATEELVQMQSQRYFVERSFQEAKQEAGMSQYQVRGWLAWHHHMVIVMMALHFILSEKMLLKDKLPLLSAYDVREIILNTYPKKGTTEKEIIEQMHKRHQQRKIKLTQKNTT
jgi:SRSO17 transposase